MYSTSDIDNIYTTLYNYVKSQTITRDETHNYVHLQKVTDNSIEIYNEIDGLYYSDLKIIIAIAFLHDLWDHKYLNIISSLQEKEDKKNCKELLLQLKYEPQDIQLIFKIIDKISYSNEVKELKHNINYRKNWLESLGEKGLLYRDIVSDADKLDAIGKKGLVRCILYTKEKGVLDIRQNVIEHCEDKLLNLHKFIMTNPGKEKAKELQIELEFEYNELKK